SATITSTRTTRLWARNTATGAEGFVVCAAAMPSGKHAVKMEIETRRAKLLTKAASAKQLRSGPGCRKHHSQGQSDGEKNVPLPLRQKVPQLFLFRFQIIFGVGAGLDFARHAFGDLDSGALQGGNLVGIIGKQADAGDAQRLQHGGGQRELAV